MNQNCIFSGHPPSSQEQPQQQQHSQHIQLAGQHIHELTIQKAPSDLPLQKHSVSTQTAMNQAPSPANNFQLNPLLVSRLPLQNLHGQTVCPAQNAMLAVPLHFPEDNSTTFSQLPLLATTPNSTLLTASNMSALEGVCETTGSSLSKVPEQPPPRGHRLNLHETAPDTTQSNGTARLSVDQQSSLAVPDSSSSEASTAFGIPCSSPDVSSTKNFKERQKGSPEDPAVIGTKEVTENDTSHSVTNVGPQHSDDYLQDGKMACVETMPIKAEPQGAREYADQSCDDLNDPTGDGNEATNPPYSAEAAYTTDTNLTLSDGESNNNHMSCNIAEGKGKGIKRKHGDALVIEGSENGCDENNGN